MPDRENFEPSIADQIENLERIKEWLDKASMKDGPYGAGFAKYHDPACNIRHSVAALKRLDVLERAICDLIQKIAPPKN